ncbi:ABC-type Fe3+-hydroxamate transport system substrate-binding protein [Bacillus sp. V2I10]|nr:hypothetical protein [Bacillus sp. V2I10]MDQ0859234.1 ABC-type Fe3+-hydroxamate transport system substrate-binding protein [Bacillus sp. V2I10]
MISIKRHKQEAIGVYKHISIVIEEVVKRNPEVIVIMDFKMYQLSKTSVLWFFH